MKYISIICFSLLVSVVHAQPQGKDSSLVSHHRPGLLWFCTGWVPAREGKLRKYDRLILDITYNQLLTAGAVKQNPWRSVGCNVNTMWDIPMTNGNKVSFGVGLTYKFQKSSPKGLFLKDSSNSYTHYFADTNYSDYRKNTFGNHILAVPIEFRFRTPKWQHFKVHVGGSIGYRLRTFQKLWTAGEKGVLREKNFPDVNGLVYGVHMRVGIRNWSLFADYTLAPQFKTDKSSKTNVLAFGISVSLF